MLRLLGVLLASCWLLPHAVDANKCYACSSNSTNEQHYSLCRHFSKDNPRFMATCGEPFMGCFMEIRDYVVERRCSTVNAKTQCQIANGVKYCYCEASLCNDLNDPPLSDDEDVAEGSGREDGLWTPERSVSSPTPPIATTVKHRVEATTSSSGGAALTAVVGTTVLSLAALLLAL